MSLVGNLELSSFNGHSILMNSGTKFIFYSVMVFNCCKLADNCHFVCSVDLLLINYYIIYVPLPIFFLKFILRLKAEFKPDSK